MLQSEDGWPGHGPGPCLFRGPAGVTRYFKPLLTGLIGAGILLALCVWQVERLAWKQGLLARIDARIAEAPVPLPAHPDPKRDDYLSVKVAGRFDTPQLRVFATWTGAGPGLRIVAPFTTDSGRRVMVDRGFLPEGQKDKALTAGPATVTGNLHWTPGADWLTPAPDPKEGLWFARDIPAMAKALNTDPVLIVARSPTGDGIRPLPVTSAGIPNNHLQYAITWFLLALVWLGMTGLWLWRISRRTN